MIGKLSAFGALLALLLAIPAAAQDTGTISGTIVDSSSQVVPGASVTLTNEATAAARTLVSNERGEVAFRAVTPGSYTVKVELTGFRSLERRSNIMNASSQLDLGRLTLDIGTLSEVVTVESTGTFVETKNSDYSGLLTAKQIAQIQTKGRDVVNLLRLLPGVHYENDIDALHEHGAVQERRLRRQPERAAPRRGLQSVQPGRVPGHRSHRAVRCGRCADQPELRDAGGNRQPDAPAARHSAVRAAELLSAI
jgi:hypothetical protein